MDSKKVQKIFTIGFIAFMLTSVISPALTPVLMGIWLFAFVIWHINKINDIKKVASG